MKNIVKEIYYNMKPTITIIMIILCSIDTFIRVSPGSHNCVLQITITLTESALLAWLGIDHTTFSVRCLWPLMFSKYFKFIKIFAWGVKRKIRHEKHHDYFKQYQNSHQKRLEIDADPTLGCLVILFFMIIGKFKWL